MKLSQLKPGMQGTITKVGGEGSLRRHLLDMGLTPKTVIFVRKTAPLGDPMELYLRGYELTLRRGDAEQIEVDAAKDMYSFCTGSCSSCSACGGCSKKGNQTLS